MCNKKLILSKSFIYYLFFRLEPSRAMTNATIIATKEQATQSIVAGIAIAYV